MNRASRNRCRLSLRESAFFRGAKDDNQLGHSLEVTSAGRHAGRWLVLVAFWIWAGSSHWVWADVVQISVLGGKESDVALRLHEQVELLLVRETELQVVSALNPPQPEQSADLLVELQTGKTPSEFIGLTIHEQASGHLLRDQVLQPGSVEQIAKQLAEAIRFSRAKRAADWKGLRVHVRGAIVEEDASGHAGVLGAFADVIASQLSLSPDVVVVTKRPPRKAKDQANAEQPKPIDRQLLLEFSAVGDSLKETITVLSPDGKPQGDVTVKVERPDAELVEQTVQAALKQLAVRPAVLSKNQERQAQRYSQLADFMWSNKRPAESIGWSKASLMFGPGQIDVRRSLIDRLLEEVQDSTRPGQTSPRWTTEEVQLLAQAALQFQAIDATVLSENDAPALVTYFKPFDLLHRLQKLRQLGRHGVKPEMIDEVTVTKSIERPLELFRDVVKSKPELATPYSLAVSFMVNELIRNSSSEVAAAASLKVLNDWLTLYDELPAARKPLANLQSTLRGVADVYSPSNPGRFDEFAARLRAHPEPLIRLIGLRRDINRDAKHEQPVSPERVEQMRPFRKQAIEVLEAAVKSKDSTRIRTVLQVISETYHGAFTGPAVVAERLALGEEMLRIKAVSPRVMLDMTGDATAENAVAVHTALGKLDKLARAEPSAIHEESAASAAKRAQDARRQLELKFPDLLKTVPTRKFEVRQVMEASTKPPAYIQAVGVRQNHFVAWRLGNWGNSVQLGSASLADGTWQDLYANPGRARGSTYSMIRDSMPASTLHGDHCYFTSSPQAVGRVNVDDGSTSDLLAGPFPKGTIRALGMLGDDLIIGSDSGWLMRFNTAEDEAKLVLVASSERRPAVTSLDGGQLFEVSRMVPDPARKRMLMVLNVPQENRRPNAELWELKERTFELRRLAKLGFLQKGSVSVTLSGDSLVLADTWIVKWDLKSDKARVWSNYPVGDLAMTTQVWLPNSLTPLLCGDSIWWIDYAGLLSELSLKTGEIQTHTLEPAQHKPADSSDMNALHPVDDQRFLLYRADRVWLVIPGEPISKAAGK